MRSRAVVALLLALASPARAAEPPPADAYLDVDLVCPSATSAVLEAHARPALVACAEGGERLRRLRAQHGENSARLEAPARKSGRLGLPESIDNQLDASKLNEIPAEKIKPYVVSLTARACVARLDTRCRRR